MTFIKTGGMVTVLLLALISSASCNKMDTHPPSALELVFANDTYELTGVAVTKEGRIFDLKEAERSDCSTVVSMRVFICL